MCIRDRVLTGHSNFSLATYNISRAARLYCPHCGHKNKDVYFICNKWTDERHYLDGIVGTITPDNIVEKMVNMQENGTQVALYNEKVLQQKKQTETDTLLQ